MIVHSLSIYSENAGKVVPARSAKAIEGSYSNPGCLSVNAREDSTDNTVFLEAQTIHRLIYGLLYLLPVRPTLDKFVDILEATVP